MALTEKLISLRKKNGFSQLDLAEKLGVSRQAISRWEVGAAVPTTENLRVLSELYGVSIDYLLSDDAEISDKVHTDDKSNVKTDKKRKKYARIGLFACILIIVSLLSVGIAIAYQNKGNDELPIYDMNKEEDSVSFSGDFSVSW
jgi:transcriptional regulator with XRE-family HTH domain